MGLAARQVHAMNATMMELSREMMKAGIIDEVRPIVGTGLWLKHLHRTAMHAHGKAVPA